MCAMSNPTPLSKLPNFDPRQVPQPDNLDRPLEERQDGGLGIFLALWGVDDFAYDHHGEVNRSTFVMNLGE